MNHKKNEENSDFQILNHVETPIPTNKTLHPETLRQFSAFAPPAVYGPLRVIATPLGNVTYNISYTSESDAAMVSGKVTYLGPDGDIERVFMDNITITTSNKVAICFKSNGVTGATVNGWIEP
ncbi:hypothetical protein [Bacillus thuringiensis]|uniref:hypothetical protein n=1 Tax=Bacillus thuringiensis TaxID=1428 RepID=UPI000BEE681B|nr:hypothetical protein [Bacillus thuringiensis]PEB64815.1 hypothetical protein COM91_29655 [Bacillus thuringiensis]PFW22613.1 hypothetical protein COL19_18210 [Bacillus thuringiensis]PGQ29642.1 hypothetical protein COA11_06820 [Bacillus thuringiensis]